MTFPAWFFAIASLLGWLTVAYLLRLNVRRLRRQSIRHIRQSSDAFMRGWFCGLRWTARKQRSLKDWQEANR